jgi:lipopolysaccharide transport system permease protein
MYASVHPSERHQVTIIRPPRLSDLSLLSEVRRLQSYGDLIATLSRHRIDVRYKQSILGGAWAVLQPLGLMAIYTLVFSRLVRMPSEGIPYALFAYAGLLPWTFFSAAVSNATGSLTTHAPLITKVYFPREILPVTYVLAALVDFCVASIALAVLVGIYRVSLTAHLAWALPSMAGLAVYATACGLILSTIQVRWRDIGVALPVILQFWMFASPVLYPLGAVPRAWRPLYVLNPVAGFVDGFRRAVVGLPPDVSALAAAAAVTAITLPVAFAAFKHLERSVADVV